MVDLPFICLALSSLEKLFSSVNRLWRLIIGIFKTKTFNLYFKKNLKNFIIKSLYKNYLILNFKYLVVFS